MKRSAVVLLNLVLITLLAKPGIVTAQLSNMDAKWAVVQQLQHGAPLEIKLNDGTTIKGKFDSASDAKLTYVRSGKASELFRSDVFEIYQLVSKSKTKSALTGLGIGAGAGAGVGAIIGVKTAPHESGEAHVPAVLSGMIGAGIGTVVGFLMGRGNKRVLIYRAV